jgi:DNA-binding GntR family transcriptional regulator
MSNGRTSQDGTAQVLDRLPEIMQLGTRVYQVLLNGIVNGAFEPGAALRPDAIARQLEVSTTPVREALHRLEGDGLAVKQPNQGWFVREHTRQQIQELYEFRAALECFSVRLACQRIGPDELAWLRGHQATGQAALEAGDMDAYRIYNRDLHAAILSAAKNSCLTGMMGQLRLQSEMLMAKTIRIAGRPVRAIEEHQQLIEFIGTRDAGNAERVMEHHISSALADIVRWGRGPDAESGNGNSSEDSGRSASEKLLPRLR